MMLTLSLLWSVGQALTYAVLSRLAAFCSMLESSSAKVFRVTQFAATAEKQALIDCAGGTGTLQGAASDELRCVFCPGRAVLSKPHGI